MDKTYDHKKVEERIYRFWEDKGYFKPEFNPKGKPYSIILPPPNANAPLHFGHAMYVIEDILVRYHRMKGDKTLWLPGADHAGFETQFVFEQKLKKEGKSRFDYDREILYKMISDYVSQNRPIMESQLKRLGFSLDWSRSKFTLDSDVISIVYKTFKKLYDDGLIYRAERLVNYCTFDGTSFSDLEVLHVEKESMLYFVKYKLKDGGFIEIATTRPETILADVAIAINPKDKRYKESTRTAIVPMVNREAPIIEDSAVDMKFGTGALKITPGHDQNDFDIAQRHGIKGISIIGFDGKLKKEAGKYKGLYPKQAREKIVEDLKKDGLISKEEKFIHQVPVCYKCKNIIEPLFMEQWFIKMEPLAKPAINILMKNKIKIIPKRFWKALMYFLENIRDWNISRQIVWGIRIPAFKNKKTGGWKVTDGEVLPESEWQQDTDTFDTWFSSSQWPFATLMTTKDTDFTTFYPTKVMETGYDILRWWVARMIMMGNYVIGKIPFENVVLHGLVKDPLGKKMSKSKGNVVDPLELVDQYGADSVRFALVYGTALGNDQSLSYPKLQSARNFSNKLWNMARFIDMNRNQKTVRGAKKSNEKDKQMVKRIKTLIAWVTKYIEEYKFNHASDLLYDFIWHEFADKYIEDVKKRLDENSFSTLNSSFLILLKLLHPFMPFVTEEVYQKLGGEGSLMIQKWPFDSAQGRPK